MLLIVLMLGVEVFRPLRELVALYHRGMVAMSATTASTSCSTRSPEVVDPAETATGRRRRQPARTRGPLRGRQLRATRRARARRSRDLSFTLRGRQDARRGRPERRRQVDPGLAAAALLRSRQRPRPGRRPRRPRDPADDAPRGRSPSSPRTPTCSTARSPKTCASRKPDATQAELEAAARAANAHEFISAAAARLRDGRRRARRAPLRRPAPAPRHRPGAAEGRADPGPGRGALQRRRRERGRDPAGARTAPAGPHDAGDRPPPLERGQRRPDPGAGGRPGRRARPPRRAAGAPAASTPA